MASARSARRWPLRARPTMSASSTSGGAPSAAALAARGLAVEQQVLARPLRSLVRRPAVTCRADASIREGVGLMHVNRVGSLVIVDAAGAPVGIFTTHDLIGV